MCIISVENFRRCKESHQDWDLGEHIEMYGRFRVQDYDEEYLKNQLNRWGATRGAFVQWEFHQIEALLQQIPNNVNLGCVTEEQIDSIVKKVIELDIFKKTKSRKMVFGSKLAHFFYPHLVPVLDSEVRELLNKLEHEFPLGCEIPEEIRQQLGKGNNGRKYFPKGGCADIVYKNYFIIGNHCLNECREETENVTDYIHNTYNFNEIVLNAKVFEWCLLGWVIAQG